MEDNKTPKLGLEPAFSSITQCQSPEFFDTAYGMSKRSYIATQITQGLVSGANTRSPFVNPMDSTDYIIPNDIVRLAYSITDELLKQENL